MFPASLFSLIVWILALEILSIVFIPLLNRTFPRYPDKAYGISKTLGFFSFGLLTWLIPSYLPLKTGVTFCITIVVLLYLFARCCGGTLAFYKSFFSQNKKQIIIVESLFIGGLIICSLIRALNPEIFWGEKPMDSALLLYFTRLDSLPPNDPWSSGTPMRYYYLGSLMFASLLKLTRSDPAIGYNLAMASIPSFCLASFYSLFASISRKSKYAVMAAIAAITLSNLEIMNLILIGKKEVDFDTFWAATRLFTPPGFTEYPLWSFLFADLHAHVVSEIVCTMLLAALPGFIMSKSGNIRIIRLILIACSLASLMLMNTWDFLVYGLLITILLIAKTFLLEYRENNNLIKSITELLKNGLLLSVVGLFITLPYLQTANPSSAAHWGWNGVSEYNKTDQVIRHFGSWLLISLAAFVYIFMRYSKRINLGTLQLIFTSLMALIPIGLGIIGHRSGLTPPPWGILIISAMMIQLSLIGLFLAATRSLLIFFACICLLTVGLMLGFVEVLFLIDRMNTTFKFYNSFWIVLAAGSLALSIFMLQQVRQKSITPRIVLSTLRIFCCIIFTICLSGGLVNIYIAIYHKRTEGPRFTLNGQSYLESTNASEYEMIKWINSNISGNPTILEAYGESYGPYTRIVMHTGLSTVLGWDHHVKQRGTPEADVQIRKEDIKTIYQSSNIQEAEKLLEKYGIELIVVGKLERDKYISSNVDKFENNPDLYPLLFRGQEILLFTRARSIMSTATYKPITIGW